MVLPDTPLGRIILESAEEEMKGNCANQPALFREATLQQLKDSMTFTSDESSYLITNEELESWESGAFDAGELKGGAKAGMCVSGYLERRGASA